MAQINLPDVNVKSVAEFVVDGFATAAVGAILAGIFLNDASPLTDQGFSLVIVGGGAIAMWKLMRSLKWIDK